MNLSTVFFFVNPYNQVMVKKLRKICVIDAPSKINLHLRIGDKRPDGFHNLESLFASVAFSDTIRFECFEEDGECFISVDWEEKGKDIGRENIPMKDNLVFKAASLFRERTGFKNALNIHLDKRVPARAGLGGGSSDAASTLIALNFLAAQNLAGKGLCCQRLDDKELMKMAANLGSDVPFFLVGGAAFVSGRGENIKSLDFAAFEGLWVVLVKPPFHSDTAAAFSLLDSARKNSMIFNPSCLCAFVKRYSEKGSEKKALTKEDVIRSLKEPPSSWPFYNDFLSVFPQQQLSQYRSILEKLEKLGASFAGLSGSGSACFGIFGSEEAAEKAANDFSVQGFFARYTFFLAHIANPVLEY